MGDPPPAAVVPKPCCVCRKQGCLHCTKCKSRHYCGKACQLVDWYERGHKEAEFQDRMLDALMPEKLKIKAAQAIVEGVAPAAGSKARLSAVRMTAAAIVKASVLNDGKTNLRGTCPICLDLLPLEINSRAMYDCCCEWVCDDCCDKCSKYDHRCPLCRAPAPTSDAEWLRRLQKHVDEGNADAMVQLGDAYHYGDMGLEESLEQAFQMYELAAVHGHATAQVEMGNNSR